MKPEKVEFHEFHVMVARGTMLQAATAARKL